MNEHYGTSHKGKAYLSSKPILVLLAMSLGIIIYMAIPKTWEEAVTQKEDGSYGLSKTWERTVTRKVEKIKKHRLYALIATNDGYFECAHSLVGKFYLKAGEIYRYGTTGETTIGRGYSEIWLIRNNLSFKIILEGNLTLVMAEQAALIGSYPLMPENMLRPLPGDELAKPYWFRLVIPPGNKSLD
jgi:hypothetical protein